MTLLQQGQLFITEFGDKFLIDVVVGHKLKAKGERCNNEHILKHLFKIAMLKIISRPLLPGPAFLQQSWPLPSPIDATFPTTLHPRCGRSKSPDAVANACRWRRTNSFDGENRRARRSRKTRDPDDEAEQSLSNWNARGDKS